MQLDVSSSEFLVSHNKRFIVRVRGSVETEAMEQGINYITLKANMCLKACPDLIVACWWD